MATKSEMFRYFQEREGPDKAKKASKTTGKRVKKNAVYVLEDSSRRSTRKSKTHLKTSHSIGYASIAEQRLKRSANF